MPDMLTALKNAGLLSEKAEHEAAAQQQLDSEALTASKAKGQGEKERRLNILRATNSLGTFRLEAHKLLLSFPESVAEITKLAHDRGMHERRSEGGGRLISNLLDLRKNLNNSGFDDDQKMDYIKQVFPKK